MIQHKIKYNLKKVKPINHYANCQIKQKFVSNKNLLKVEIMENNYNIKSNLPKRFICQMMSIMVRNKNFYVQQILNRRWTRAVGHFFHVIQN